ncbi:MAG: hypothetical protein FWC78_07130 [Defluviitaleaceae bacterium]|nr:hypothetical protein [Defluviitaleaceae bacterium]
MAKKLILSVAMVLLVCFMPVSVALAQNPILPLWEHVPDPEMRVIEYPYGSGEYRLFVIGSHDVKFDLPGDRFSYCGPDVRMWSAPVSDLTDWRDEGPIFTFQDPVTGLWDTMFAPSFVEVNRRSGPDAGRWFYLYPHSRAPGREAMVARSRYPMGPYEIVNLNPDGRTLQQGSIIGFDPHVYVYHITDPNDPDYEIGFRAFAYWGFVRAFAAELDQSTMFSLRPGTTVFRDMIPASSAFGVLYNRGDENPDWPGIMLHPGEELSDVLGQFNYFEAFSIERYEDERGHVYLLIFSGRSGPDYGIGDTNSAKRFAYGDTPLGPWRPGGVLVDSRAPVPNRGGTGITTVHSGHNTHGGIRQINGHWYAYYHRPPRGNSSTRQVMVAPIQITWDGQRIADGGTVTITGYDACRGEAWTATGGAHEFTGVQVTSEGFQVYGLNPFQYYSAGIVSFMYGGSWPNNAQSTLHSAWNIWDNHQPIIGATASMIYGYKHFAFGGVTAAQGAGRGVPYFEGVQAGANTQFHLYLAPRVNLAFTVDVWLDGPWADGAWNGILLGTIEVPADSVDGGVQRFSIDASAVEGLTGKHAIFIRPQGFTGQLLDIMGLGFSDDTRPLVRPYVPTVSIYYNGIALALSPTPLRSRPYNGITSVDIYEYRRVILPGATDIPTITAAVSDPNLVTIEIEQMTDPLGTAFVRFDFNGMVKTYRIVHEAWSPWEEPVRHVMRDSSPQFTYPARVAWGDVIGGIDPPNGAVTFTINVEEAGLYRLSVYHTSAWGEATHNWQINQGGQVAFDYPTGGWQVSQFPEYIELNAGDNTITVSAESGITELRWIEVERYLEMPTENTATNTSNTEESSPSSGVALLTAEPPAAETPEETEEPEEHDEPEEAEAPAMPEPPAADAADDSGINIVVYVVIAIVAIAGIGFLVAKKVRKN